MGTTKEQEPPVFVNPTTFANLIPTYGVLEEIPGYRKRIRLQP